MYSRRSWFPEWIKGTVKEIKAGAFTVEEMVAVIATEEGDKELTMMQRWPVRKGRPYQEEAAAGKTTGNRTACYRYIVPNRQRWCGSCSGTVRKRQDSYPASVG